MLFWKEDIRQRLGKAVAACGYECATEKIVVERARNLKMGDYASNIAMVLAKAAGKPPRELAAEIVAGFTTEPFFADLTVAGPGFINIKFADSIWSKLVEDISDAKSYDQLPMNCKRFVMNMASGNPRH